MLRGMLLSTLAAIIIPCIAARSAPEQACGGLHAAIRAELVRRDPPYTQPPFVMLTFVLLNDSEKPINTVEEGWKIVVDGKDVEESDFIFGNGVTPVGGWGTLNPGESYEFGKGLELSRYFPEEREYRVSWKGKGFRSSTITVRVDHVGAADARRTVCPIWMSLKTGLEKGNWSDRILGITRILGVERVDLAEGVFLYAELFDFQIQRRPRNSEFRSRTI
jgi:hypothetical protein